MSESLDHKESSPKKPEEAGHHSDIESQQSVPDAPQQGGFTAANEKQVNNDEPRSNGPQITEEQPETRPSTAQKEQTEQTEQTEQNEPVDKRDFMMDSDLEDDLSSLVPEEEKSRRDMFEEMRDRIIALQESQAEFNRNIMAKVDYLTSTVASMGNRVQSLSNSINTTKNSSSETARAVKGIRLYLETERAHSEIIRSKLKSLAREADSFGTLLTSSVPNSNSYHHSTIPVREIANGTANGRVTRETEQSRPQQELETEKSNDNVPNNNSSNNYSTTSNNSLTNNNANEAQDEDPLEAEIQGHHQRHDLEDSVMEEADDEDEDGIEITSPETPHQSRSQAFTSANKPTFVVRNTMGFTPKNTTKYSGFTVRTNPSTPQQDDSNTSMSGPPSSPGEIITGVVGSRADFVNLTKEQLLQKYPPAKGFPVRKCTTLRDIFLDYRELVPMYDYLKSHVDKISKVPNYRSFQRRKRIAVAVQRFVDSGKYTEEEALGILEQDKKKRRITGLSTYCDTPKERLFEENGV